MMKYSDAFDQLKLEIYIIFLIFLQGILTILPLSTLPNFILMTIYFFRWLGVNKPNLVFLITIGLIQDIISNPIIGITSLEYTIMSYFLHLNYSALKEQNFIVIWIAFAILRAALGLVEISMINYVFNMRINYTIESLQLFIDIVFYPAVHYLYLKRLYCLLPKDAR